MYIDRMFHWDGKQEEKLACSSCSEILGVRVRYSKENRPAYRLFVDAAMKKRASINSVDMSI